MTTISHVARVQIKSHSSVNQPYTYCSNRLAVAVSISVSGGDAVDTENPNSIRYASDQ